MNNNNIFKGQCYGCNNQWKYIVYMQSWKGVRQDDGSYFKGGWINLCLDCCKKFGLSPNRVPNTCNKCSEKFIGKKDSLECSKCSNNIASDIKQQENLIKELLGCKNKPRDDKDKILIKTEIASIK